MQTKKSKVLALRGKRQVVTITSAERGVLSTACLCMSAAGHFIPPFIIFPRVRLTEKLKVGAPPGTTFSCNPSGWMTAKEFNSWFDHFIQNVSPTEDNPVVLILDGHSSHTKNLEFVDKARDNHVTVISLPPHCSHKLQPLDVSFMGPFKTHFSQAIETYLKNKPGEVVTLNEVSELLGKAYLRAANVSTAVSGFRKTGIAPFNRFVFGDEDFAPAEVTDIPQQTTTLNYPDSEDEGPFLGFNNESSEEISTRQSQRHDESFSASLMEPAMPLKPLIKSFDSDILSPMVSIPVPSNSSFDVSPLMIRPLPKSNRRKKMSSRKSEKSSILTSSPHRGALKLLQANKEINQIKKIKRNSGTNAEKKGKRTKKHDTENLPHDTQCSYYGVFLLI